MPELVIRSQHPFASGIGEPFVYGVDLPNHPQILAAAGRSVDAGARVAAAPHLVDALTPFTLRPYMDRLRAILST